MESIAGELGVSKSAVSKALNGKTDISKELRDTILRKAKELHYSKAPFYHILVLSAARYFGKNGSYYQQLVRMLRRRWAHWVTPVSCAGFQKKRRPGG